MCLNEPPVFSGVGVAAGSSVAVAPGASSSSSPHPANPTRNRQANRSARGLVMGGDDNDRAVPLTPAIARYDHVLLDLDGCLWVGDEAVEGAPEAVAALREAGKGIAYVTNDVRHAPDHFVRKLWRLRLPGSLHEV